MLDFEAWNAARSVEITENGLHVTSDLIRGNLQIMAGKTYHANCFQRLLQIGLYGCCQVLSMISNRLSVKVYTTNLQEVAV